MVRPSSRSAPGLSLLDMLISIPGFQVPVQIVVLETLYSLIQQPPTMMAQLNAGIPSTLPDAPQPSTSALVALPPAQVPLEAGGLEGALSAGARVSNVPPPSRSRQRFASGAPHPSRERAGREREGRDVSDPRGNRLLISGPEERDDAECVSSSGPSGDPSHMGESSAPDLQKVLALRGHSAAAEEAAVASSSGEASAPEAERPSGSGTRGPSVPMASARRSRDESPSDDEGLEVRRAADSEGMQFARDTHASDASGTYQEVDVEGAAAGALDEVVKLTEQLEQRASAAVEGLGLALDQIDLGASLVGRPIVQPPFPRLIGEELGAGLRMDNPDGSRDATPTSDHLFSTELAQGEAGLGDPGAGPPVGEYGYSGMGAGWFTGMAQEPAVPINNEQLVAVLLNWITNHSGKDDNNLLATGPGSGEVHPSYPMQELIQSLIHGAPSQAWLRRLQRCRMSWQRR